MTNLELVLASWLWLLVLSRCWRHAWRNSGRTSAWVTAMLALQALVMTLDWTPFADVVEARLPAHSLLLTQCCCAIAAAAIFVWMASCEQKEIRGGALQVRMTIVAVPLMIVSFVFAPVHQRGPADFWVSFTPRVATVGWAPVMWIVVYWIAFAGTLFHGLWVARRYIFGYLKSATQRRIRVTLWVFVANCVLTQFYILNGTAVLAMRAAGYHGEWLSPVDGLMRFSESLGAMALFAGAAWINLRLRATAELVPIALNLVRLRGLWLDMRQAVPTFQVGTQSLVGVGLIADIRLHLYRRLIEIRDGYLGIAPWYAREDALLLCAAHPQVRTPESNLAQATSWELARRRMLRGDQPMAQTTTFLAGEAQTWQEELALLRGMARFRRRAHKLADDIEARLPEERVAALSLSSDPEKLATSS